MTRPTAALVLMSLLAASGTVLAQPAAPALDAEGLQPIAGAKVDSAARRPGAVVTRRRGNPRSRG